MDYKQKYIELKKSLSALKRGNPTKRDLEILECSIDEFYNANQYLVVNEFNIKQRKELIKKLEQKEIDLFDLYNFIREIMNG